MEPSEHRVGAWRELGRETEGSHSRDQERGRKAEGSPSPAWEPDRLRSCREFPLLPSTPTCTRALSLHKTKLSCSQPPTHTPHPGKPGPDWPGLSSDTAEGGGGREIFHVFSQRPHTKDLTQKDDVEPLLPPRPFRETKGELTGKCVWPSLQ